MATSKARKPTVIDIESKKSRNNGGRGTNIMKIIAIKPNEK